MGQSSLGYGPIALAAARDTASAFGQKYIANGLSKVAEPYGGITTAGRVIPGLFSLQRTGVSTAGIRAAAEEYLAALGPELLPLASLSMESDEWRKWSNIHRTLMRHGLCLGELQPAPRARAHDLLRASLSLQGFEAARDIMRLNETLAEMTGKPDEYGEAYYWLSIFGTPSEREPWGWQLDGHHLNLNYAIVGDQVVMTPAFMIAGVGGRARRRRPVLRDAGAGRGGAARPGAGAIAGRSAAQPGGARGGAPAQHVYGRLSGQFRAAL